MYAWGNSPFISPSTVALLTSSACEGTSCGNTPRRGRVRRTGGFGLAIWHWLVTFMSNWVACRYVWVMLFVLLLFVIVCVESSWTSWCILNQFGLCWLPAFVRICRASWPMLFWVTLGPKLFGTGWPHYSQMGWSSESMLQIVGMWNMLKNKRRTEHTRHKFLQIQVNSCTYFATNHLHTTSRRWPSSPRFLSWPFDVKGVELFFLRPEVWRRHLKRYFYRWNQQIDFFPSAMVHERSMAYYGV